MKKKALLSFLIVLILCCGLTVPAFAELGFESYILQPQSTDYLSPEGLQEGEEIAREIADRYGFVASCVFFDSNGGRDNSEVTREIYNEVFGGYDGIILSIFWEEGQIYGASFGRAGDLFAEVELKMLINSFDSGDSLDDCVKEYLYTADNMFLNKQRAAEAEGGSIINENVGPEAIPDQRLKPRVVDDAELLDPQEEEALNQMLDEISERQELDVAVVTAENFGGMEPQAFADDFFDYQGYGCGEGADGILFAIDMENRDWAISTHGYGITAFTDNGQRYLRENFLSYISDGDYFEGFKRYAETCDELISMARSGEPYDTDENGTDKSFWFTLIPVSLAVGFIIAFIGAKHQQSKLKSVVKKAEAGDYTRPGSAQLWCSEDRYLDRNVTRQKIQRESSSSGGSSGGSSTHTSSSGRTHGGSSGKF